ncbi:hypothetical protein J4E05_16720 [Thalassospira sp. NFXS8]|uniref:hypothetical protein n=1 Tax=Thalassospira sp. NFXS8 TaxID=2819093 RepID=UPI0032DF2B3E
MVKVNSNDIAFMLEKLELTPVIRESLQSMRNPSDINEDMADEIRDICIERLDEIGFDEDYELTAIGKKLDILIDKLFVG